jgi:hypothetical protein
VVPIIIVNQSGDIRMKMGCEVGDDRFHDIIRGDFQF